MNISIPTEQSEALGLTQSHLVDVVDGGATFQVHREAVESFRLLQNDLFKEGFILSLASAFRSFDRQLAIFNGKANGLRPVLDANGRELNVKALSDDQLLMSILRWSALPGVSRHHFGSDLDVFDAARMRRSDVQLLPSEVEGEGKCAAMHDYLDDLIDANKSYGFYRPYQYDTGGIAAERWHLSYAPVSCSYEALVEKQVLELVWKENSLSLLNEVLANFDTIQSNFIAIQAQNRPAWL